MPATVTVELEGGEPGNVFPRHVYGLVSSWVERDWSMSQHQRALAVASDPNARQRLKPYTAAPAVDRSGRLLQIAVQLLDDALADEVAKRAGANPRVTLGPEAFRVGAVDTTTETWGRLATGTGGRGDYLFTFRTPVIFRSGNASLPLPQPGSVFGHLRRRWNAFVPESMAVGIDLASVRLSVSHLDVHTVAVEFRRGSFVGLMGEVAFAARDADGATRSALETLGRFARYAGVGSFTTAGFGVTEFALARVTWRGDGGRRAAGSSRQR